MRADLALFFIVTLVACGPDDGDAGKDSADTASGRSFADFVDVQATWAGDTTCFSGTLVDTPPDPTCQVPLTIDGVVLDFQEDEPVEDPTVQIWLDDDIDGTPEIVQADGDGAFEIDVTACSAFAYATFTPPEEDRTKDTYEVHQVYPGEADGRGTGSFNSVSDATARLIPGLIGVRWAEDSTGIVAGTAYGCDGQPLENVQVFVHDGAGNVPSTGDVYFFSEGEDDLPTTRDEVPDTEVNGLWVVMDLAPGTWTIEMWGWDGAAHVELGSTVVTSIAGVVNISNIYTGDADGVYFPPSCTTPCDG